MSLDDQMAQLFVEEARESLRDFEQCLLLLESLPDDEELVGKLFRCAHTLKGNSRIMGYEVITSFTHELENLLDGLRRGELMVTTGVADTLLASLDVLKELIEEVAGGEPHAAGPYADALRRLQALAGEIGEGGDKRAGTPPPTLELPEPAAPAMGVSVPAPLVASIPTPAPEPAESHCESAEPPAVEPALTQLALVQTAVANDDVHGHANKAAPGADKARDRKAAAAAQDSEGSSVRVPIEKLDRLINLTGEVVIAQSMIAQLVTDLTPDRISVLQEVVAQMDRHCRELQERMLGARMLPVRNVFVRFLRLVRDLAAATGKDIALDLAGEDTELDKTVIEKIADPLTHLVRNAIDHGVETPEERVALGKPPQARVNLSAYQKGGSIFIEVSDDGRGVDRAKVLAKARSRGLIAEGAEPSEEDTLALIFLPGFSTAEKVTELSGRGVGMDVVKRNVESLKGTITTLSTPGKGTCFRLKLPLTLAILDGLGVRVGEQVFLVPLVSVIESLQPRASDVHILPGMGDVVDVRGEFLPLVRLFEVFQVKPSFKRAQDGIVMVIDDGSQKLALQVDELIGQYQVVIKSLETNFTAVPGVAGATVLGDGRVALILDAGQLAGIARTNNQRADVELSAPRSAAAGVAR
jgi:two-component system chemotaxis sensor kinase CheA